MPKLYQICLIIALVHLLPTNSVIVSLDDALDIIKVGKDIVVTLAKAWDIVDDSYDFSDTPTPFIEKTERKLFRKMDAIQKKMEQLNTEIHAVGMQTISGFTRYLPDRIKLELRLNDLLDYMTRLQVFYGDYLNYYMKHEDFERLTLEDFAKTVTSHGSGSVRSLVERIHAFIAPSDTGFTDSGILGPLSNNLKVQ